MEHLDDVLLDRYLDGDLEAGERAMAEVHLAGCARCREELAAARAFFATFAAVPQEPLAVDLAPRVLRRVGPEAARRRRWLVTGALAAQAALALALAVWLLPSLLGGYLPMAQLDWSPDALRDWLPPRVSPLAAVAPLQWALVVAGLAVVWLVGTRLALTGAARGPREEAS